MSSMIHSVYIISNLASFAVGIRFQLHHRGFWEIGVTLWCLNSLRLFEFASKPGEHFFLVLVKQTILG
jgi:hypothetical protein